jgi:putative tricarboxylic transport membrane protein
LGSLPEEGGRRDDPRGGREMSDRILGGAMVLLAVFYIWASSLTEISFISDPVGPKTFPMIIGGLVGISGLAIFLRTDPEPQWPAAGSLIEIFAAVVLLFIYAAVLPELGFVVCTAFAASFLSWRLGSRPIEAIVAGIAMSVGIYVVFHLILGLSLARGPWGF